MKGYVIVMIALLVTTGAQAQQSGMKLGTTPPGFDLPVLRPIGRDSIALSDLRNRAVVMDFWATWCTPCIKSFPHLNTLIGEYRDKPVTFLAVTYEPEALVGRFLEHHELKSIIASDSSFQTFRSYNGWAIPTTILITKDGRYAGRIHPKRLTGGIIDSLLEGQIPKVEQVPENLYDPAGAEKYFRSLLKKSNG